MNPTKNLGAKEKGWGDDGTENCYSGCTNACNYCYARLKAMRFLPKHLVAANPEVLDMAWEAWGTHPVVNWKQLQRKSYPRKGTIMFPSTHDITDKNVVECERFLLKVLEAGNRVRLVTKADPSAINYLLENTLPRIQHKAWFKGVEFRITGGTLDKKTYKLWEPKAPSPNDRRVALLKINDANLNKVIVSWSAEPGFPDVATVFKEVASYVTTFWFGPMNHVEQLKKFWSEACWSYYLTNLRQFYSPDGLREIVKVLQAQDHDKKLRLKSTVPQSRSQSLKGFLKPNEREKDQIIQRD